jgi:apolipoprotein N-acyltransferase
VNGFRKVAAVLGAALTFAAFVLATVALFDATNRCPASQCRDAALSVALYIAAGIFCILATKNTWPHRPKENAPKVKQPRAQGVERGTVNMDAAPASHGYRNNNT